MEISTELTNFILENGFIVIKRLSYPKNLGYEVKVVLDRTKHSSLIEEFENILKLYDTAIFYANYKISIGDVFQNGIIVDVHCLKSTKVYYLIFDQIKDNNEMEIKISDIKFNKGV